MKKNYLFVLFFIFCLNFQGQTNCSEADPDILYAYSDVKDSYESNNISHLKEYAYKSLKAFERAKPKLLNCGCEASYNLAYDAAELLAKVDATETYEDGRFYVKRARDIAKQSLIELEKCTASTQEENSSNHGDELASLKDEQAKLKQQQMELKLKEQEIKLKLEEQNKKELQLKKEKLISQYDSVISTNVKSYNNALELCNCNHEKLTVKNNSGSTSQSIEDIKAHYLNSLKLLAKTYLSYLDTCSE